MKQEGNKSDLQSLIEQRITFDSMTEGQKTKYLAKLIDCSIDQANKKGIELGIALAEAAINSVQDLVTIALLHYYAANAYAWLSRAKMLTNKIKYDDWTQGEKENEILHLRKAILGNGFGLLPIQYRCSILTNLANSLSTIGRSIEGLKLLRRTVSLLPEYGMSVGNVGSHLLLLSNYMPTDAYRTLYLNAALPLLEQALTTGKGLTRYAREDFDRKRDFILNVLGSNRIDLASLDLGKPNRRKTKREADYRYWVSKETLFLCPINDIFPLQNGGHDCLHLPDIIHPIHEGPHLHGIANQLIQEYVSIRYQVYEGIHERNVHFSDRKVNLINTLDYSSYSLALERLRGAFRVMYSLFDKIAFFLNLYFNLGMKEHDVDFGKIWFKYKNTLREEFVQRIDNKPLQGLFWLSKDLFGRDNRYLEPEADEIKKIRNYVEHKYLKILEYGEPDIQIENDSDFTNPFEDKIAFKISRDRFVEKTKYLLSLARSALIYLILAVEYEERGKRDDYNIVSIPMSGYDENWKR